MLLHKGLRSMFTGKDRVITAVKGQQADRIPVTVMFGAYAAKIAGCTVKEFLTNAEKNAQCHVCACEFFEPDTITLATDLYLEAQSLGAKVEFPEDSTSHLVSYVLEDEARLSNLSIPDPQKTIGLLIILKPVNEQCYRLRVPV